MELAILDQDGRLATYISSSGLWSFNPSNDDKSPYLLFHSLRFKGALPVSSSQSKAFRVLCMNGNEPIVTVQKVTSSTQAASVCEQISSEFVPPKTPIQWVRALEKVAPMSAGFLS